KTTILLFLLGVGFGGDDGGFEHPFENDALRVPTLDTSGGALIRDVTIHDAVNPAHVGDILVRRGIIESIGDDLEAPDGVLVIDGSGKHIAPGAIDTHSHLAIERGINEATLSITADCNISNVINADDVGLYRALAGGVTVIQPLHGSANAIGGRSEVLELKWHRTADELRFPDAPQGIKFALGENVKQSNWGPHDRFPGTRPGVERVFARAFRRAQEYESEWESYRTARDRGEDPVPPRRDIRLDVLVGIMHGDVLVNSHCYRADEILMLLRTAERFGFRIQVLQHVLEGYKVAYEIAEHGAGTSTFSDWWAYKQEAYDAIPQNAALLDEAGVVSTINSDSDELIRHLYHEAGKSVRYAGMDPVRALRLCTLNGAIQLGIDDRVGSIEEGKLANLVLMDGDPFSVYTRVEWTMVDGEIQFQRRDAFGLDAEPAPVRDLKEGPLPAYEGTGGPITAIVGGTLHPVTSEAIEGGTLILEGNRIAAIGKDLPVPADARVIDASGKDVWPGMIALSTPIGLTEIDSVRGTQDQSEMGGNQPDLRVASSIHAASAHIGVARTNGITRSQTVPGGSGPFQGQSAVLRLAGDTWEEMLQVDRDMLHIRFPAVGNRAEKKEEPEAVREMARMLDDAREYGRLVEEAASDGTTPPPFDSRLEALVPYARGEKHVGIHADNAQTILFALKFIEEQGLDAVLYGVREGWKVAGAIARAGVPVVVGPVLSVPRSEFDPYDAAYSNPAVLARAGVHVAIMANDGANTRNTPFHAGFASAFGLPREEALRSVTYYAAEVLGLESQLGSLAPGKLADVVITRGDLLETTTPVDAVFIDGALQDVKNRQTRLYERYRDRLHRLEAE
ncbi:MAG TPA: amidohydrolase, partial [Planctomycetes bacterium]|nr:amidohydrolase [Planctomycetota bacterium]